jgi:hypothetical protein
MRCPEERRARLFLRASFAFDKLLDAIVADGLLLITTAMVYTSLATDLSAVIMWSSRIKNIWKK